MSAMQIITRSRPRYTRESDITGQLVDAISQELWHSFGHKGVLNWTGAMNHLHALVDQVREEARETCGGRRSLRPGPATGPTRRMEAPARRATGDAGMSVGTHDGAPAPLKRRERHSPLSP